MKKEYLLTGPLEPTNRPYAVAKIAGIEMCWSYNRQYGTKFLAAMPTNLYAPGDNYDLMNSHVIPALIRKFHLANLAQQGDIEAIGKDEAVHGRIPDDLLLHLGLARTAAGEVTRDAHGRPQQSVIVWGGGMARRGFLYSDDLADACVFLMNLPEVEFDSLLGIDAGTQGRLDSERGGREYESDAAPVPPTVNIGVGADLTIRELAEIVKSVLGYTGTMSFDVGMSEGTPRKLLDVGRLHRLGWRAQVKHEDGLPHAFQDYLNPRATTTNRVAR
jgi:GDP-L-fucose synthase